MMDTIYLLQAPDGKFLTDFERVFEGAPLRTSDPFDGYQVKGVIGGRDTTTISIDLYNSWISDLLVGFTLKRMTCAGDAMFSWEDMLYKKWERGGNTISIVPMPGWDSETNPLFETSIRIINPITY